MLKRFACLLLVAFFMFVLVNPVAVQAQNTLRILKSSAQIDFPGKLTFTISAQSNAEIKDIRLKYAVDRLSFAEVTSEAYVLFQPGTRVDATWEWDMRKGGGLPPGTAIFYWWKVSDASGNSIETEPARLMFNDDRYSWRSLTEGLITLHWYQGDETFARELLKTAVQAQIQLKNSTGAEPEKPLHIYIYASAQDLRGAMIFPQEWTGGVAFTRHSTISIGIAPAELAWGKRAMTHEFTHLIIHQQTFNPYGDLPTWLDEGLAMYNEGDLQASFASLLIKAIVEDKLISVRSLSSPFSAFPEQAVLSYAESYTIVAFLIGNYGQSKMLELLTAFRNGSGYDEALTKVYGFDMDGLDSQWREFLKKAVKAVK
jgi:hypothetical protein